MNTLRPVNYDALTHWGWVMHICISKLTIIGWDNGLLPGRRQAIISTNAGILLIGPLGTNFSEILIEIYIFSLKKMHLKLLSGNWRPSCLCHNVSMAHYTTANSEVSAVMCPLHWLISPWTKWPPIRRPYFQMHFREWKVLYFVKTIHSSLFLRVQLTVTRWFR